MKAPTKAELKRRLELSEARNVDLEEENRQLRSGVISAQVDAPVVFVAGITAAGLPFVEPMTPSKPEPQALDLIAVHLIRMASAALTSEQSPSIRIDNLFEEVKLLRRQMSDVQSGMGGVQHIIQEQNKTIAEAISTARQQSSLEYEHEED